MQAAAGRVLGPFTLWVVEGGVGGRVGARSSRGGTKKTM